MGSKTVVHARSKSEKEKLLWETGSFKSDKIKIMTTSQELPGYSAYFTKGFPNCLLTFLFETSLRKNI